MCTFVQQDTSVGSLVIHSTDALAFIVGDHVSRALFSSGMTKMLSGRLLTTGSFYQGQIQYYHKGSKWKLNAVELWHNFTVKVMLTLVSWCISQGSPEKQNKCVCVCVCTYTGRQRPMSQLKDQCRSSEAERKLPLTQPSVLLRPSKEWLPTHTWGAIYFMQSTDSNVSSSRHIPIGPPRIMSNPYAGTFLS